MPEQPPPTTFTRSPVPSGLPCSAMRERTLFAAGSVSVMAMAVLAGSDIVARRPRADAARVAVRHAASIGRDRAARFRTMARRNVMPAAIYLDHLSTTPLDPRVLDAMLPYLRERFGHPSAKSHAFGWEAEQAIEAARGRVADLIAADPREIVFTSGGTEADNLAILGVAEASDAVAASGSPRAARRHLVTTAVEQRSVLDPI